MQILSSLEAYLYFRRIIHTDVEQFWVSALNSSNCLIETKKLFQGTVDSCPVHPRDIFRLACLNNASSILVAHNHPSGDATPSDDDIKTTKLILNAARIMQIRFLDHIIITEKNYYSFRDHSHILSQSQ